MGAQEVSSWGKHQVIHTIRAPLRSQAYNSFIRKTVEILVRWLSRRVGEALNMGKSSAVSAIQQGQTSRRGLIKAKRTSLRD